MLGTMLRRSGLLLLAVALALGAYHWWRTKNVSAVQRGFEVAARHGCFNCHGPAGTRGMPNPGYGLDDVPAFTGGLMTMYAKNEAEIREWIQDGMAKSVRDDPKQRALRQKAIIAMPAWRGVIGGGDLDDLVAFVKAASDFEKPQEEPAEEGRRLAAKLGCFNCHGPQGRGCAPNPGSFMGYVPSWDGADFPELAENDAEVREWILDGVTRRFRDNSVARYFLERQQVKMPAYRGHLGDSDVDRLVDYVHWLRKHPY